MNDERARYTFFVDLNNMAKEVKALSDISRSFLILANLPDNMTDGSGAKYKKKAAHYAQLANDEKRNMINFFNDGFLKFDGISIYDILAVYTMETPIVF